MSGLGFSARIRISPIGFIIIGLCGLAIIYYLTTHSSYNDSSDSVSIKQLLASAIELAQNGGDEVRNVKENQNDNLQVYHKENIYCWKFNSGILFPLCELLKLFRWKCFIIYMENRNN